LSPPLPPRRRLCPTVLVALHSSQLLLRHAAAWYALPALFPTPLDPSPALACSILGHHSTLGTVARAQATASHGHSGGGGGWRGRLTVYLPRLPAAYRMCPNFWAMLGS